ncbi:MAG: tetratricopeptide repeat protein [Cyanobacteria bacterium P01_D01_bin.71]
MATAWSRVPGQQGCCHIYLQGWRYREHGHRDAALRAFRELLTLGRQWGHQGWIGAAEKAIADLATVTSSECWQATSTITAADLETAKQCSKAALLHEQGHWPQALQVYQHLLAVATQAQQPWAMGRCLNGLGLIYLEQQRFTLAATCLQTAVAVLADLEAPVQSATVLHNLGLAHDGQGHYQLAQSCFKNALECWQMAEDDLGVALTLDYLGRTYARGQEAWLALGSFEAAADVLYELGQHTDVRSEAAALLSQMALLCERFRYYDLAIAYWNATLEIYQTLSLIAPQVCIWQQLSQLYRVVGHEAIARHYVNCMMPAIMR